MKAPVTRALLLGFCAAVSPAVGQAPTSGADAVRNIDWVNMPASSPIPETLPTADSNDPVEAGFARQWFEHSLQDLKTDELALKIISSPRDPNDQWSYHARAALRDLVRTEVPNGRNARVFCNGIGCLCYVERDEPGYVLHPIVYTRLTAGRGREAPFGPGDTFGYWMHVSHAPGVPWEITIVRHSADVSAKPPPM
jgi:hypothetical protein